MSLVRLTLIPLTSKESFRLEHKFSRNLRLQLPLLPIAVIIFQRSLSDQHGMGMFGVERLSH